MIRRLPTLALLIGIVTGMATVLAAPAQPSASPQERLSVSRDHVTVTSDVVRLGDLFANTGDKAQIIVENAPAPRMQVIYDVHRLAAIARAHRLTWQARSWSERVVIERAGQTIGAEQIMLALRDALERASAAKGAIEIELVQKDLRMTLPMDRPATVAVENLRRNAATGQFTAVVVAPAGDPQAMRLNVAGRVHRLIEVPTLARRMMPGDVIGRNDISWIRMRAAQVSRNIITDTERLVGTTPTRPVVAGKMLMNGEVRAPRIVTKGSLVTMLLRTPNMVLTSKGRAMEDGARGDVIRVMNLQSKTVIEGEVTSSGIVQVMTTQFMPAGAAIPQSAANRPAGR